MQNYLVSSDIVSMKPSMMNYEATEPLFKDRKLLTNSVKLHSGFTYCQDVSMMKSEVETQDNMIGLTDATKGYDYLDYQFG